MPQAAQAAGQNATQNVAADGQNELEISYFLPRAVAGVSFLSRIYTPGVVPGVSFLTRIYTPGVVPGVSFLSPGFIRRV